MNIFKNSEGYSDPTAGQAFYHNERRTKAHFLIKIFLFITKEAGFKVLNRIELEDQKTGRHY